MHKHPPTAPSASSTIRRRSNQSSRLASVESGAIDLAGMTDLEDDDREVVVLHLVRLLSSD
jgi:hypothetical protein